MRAVSTALLPVSTVASLGVTHAGIARVSRFRGNGVIGRNLNSVVEKSGRGAEGYVGLRQRRG